jgi:hypothetical protein
MDLSVTTSVESCHCGAGEILDKEDWYGRNKKVRAPRLQLHHNRQAKVLQPNLPGLKKRDSACVPL